MVANIYQQKEPSHSAFLYQIWELKYIKENENPQEKIKEAKKQIKRYEQDQKFQRLAEGTTIYKHIILAYKDRVEIMEQ